jgi:hypothetical protein
MAWNKVANDTAAVLSAEAAGALDNCAYLPGRQSQRSGDRVSACVAFWWARELMCSQRLPAVVDELYSAVRVVRVNSSRAWSSSGGVVVIERQVEVVRIVAGVSRLRHAPTIHLLPSIRKRTQRRPPHKASARYLRSGNLYGRGARRSPRRKGGTA